MVVWTPGRAGGRPLSFHPLPDFAGVRSDEDEFAAAVEAAVAACSDPVNHRYTPAGGLPALKEAIVEKTSGTIAL